MTNFCVTSFSELKTVVSTSAATFPSISLNHTQCALHQPLHRVSDTYVTPSAPRSTKDLHMRKRRSYGKGAHNGEEGGRGEYAHIDYPTIPQFSLVPVNVALPLFYYTST
jgi:hypothetical protein